MALASPLQLSVMAQWPTSHLWGWDIAQESFPGSGNTSALVTPCDLVRENPGGSKAEPCRGGGMSRGVFPGGLRTMMFRKRLAVRWH